LLQQQIIKLAMVTTGTLQCAKFQSDCHWQPTEIQFFTHWKPFLVPNQQ